MNRSTFFLKPVPPFRLDLTVWALRRRPNNAVDRWDGQTYHRVLPLPAGPVEVAVTQVGPPAEPQLQVALAGQPLRSSVKAVATAALNRLLGLEIDLTRFYRFATRQGPLGLLARRFRGMKPPRFASVFECVVNAIACQQVTLTLGILLLNRLASNYGPILGEGDETAHAFPRPVDLAGLAPKALRRLGFSRQKGQAMIDLARAITEGRLDLEELAQLSDEETIERLRGLRGVGRWTAEYVLLRGLGRTNVFPGDDQGGRNNLRRWLHLAGPLDYQGVQRTLAPWKRFGGLIYFHLLLNRLEEARYLQPTTLPVPKLVRSPKNSRAAAPRTLWTVGHSNRSAEEFVQLLRTHEVNLVVDVRKMPGSRHNPQFGRDTLPPLLQQAGIGYLHLPGLGGLRRRRPDSPNTGWENASFQGYADYMLTPQFQQSLEELLQHVDNRRAALMCAEAVPWRCHRSLIADALVVRGFAVKHILSASRTQAHVLRPWARVQGIRITYPAPAS
jgi:DNA-3-methyladenine glycosylase II